MKRAIVLAGLVFAAPAAAQSDNQGENTDTITIGVGVGTVPRYEGSSDNSLIPAGAIRGSLGGISFTTQGTALYVDLIPRRGQTGGKLVFGPVVNVELNRTSNKRTRDPQIVALGKTDVAVEVGGQIGFSQNGVITSDYDNLTISIAYLHDVAGSHSSYIVSPSISYGTPLSKATYVGVSVGADYAGRGYNQTYFGVTPAQSVASRLAAYSPGRGWKDVNFGAVGALSLSGDLRRGASLFALGNYQRLIDKVGRSPVVRDRGQWFGGVGLAYTF